MERTPELECPICLDLYTYPIILPCSHVLCRSPCAENLFDFNFIRCPVCRDNCYVTGGLGSLPKVLALENIIDKVKNNTASKKASNSDTDTDNDGGNDVFCQLCDGSPKRAKRSCLDCSASYCSKCLTISHPNRAPFSNHELVEPRLEFKVKDLVCTDHNEPLTSYCVQCKRSVCFLCQEFDLHPGHSLTSLDQASQDLKACLNISLNVMDHGRDRVNLAMTAHKDKLWSIKQLIQRRRDEIMCHCDMLIAEVENKRSFFLADLEYEERLRQTDVEDSKKGVDKLLTSVQSLTNYTKDILEKKDLAAFLQVASSLNERLAKTALDCEGCPVQLCELDPLKEKVVDFRKEKAFLRDMHYLIAPTTPIIDVSRCTRCEDTVIIVLASSKNIHDVIDYYEIHYCSEEQKNLGIEETITFRNAQEERQVVKGISTGSSLLVLMLENLSRGTTYYFCIGASNMAGKSSNSEVVQCVTVDQGESLLPVPVILESLCRRYTSSIQIFSSSPLDVSSDQKISHYLLYRPMSRNKAWRSVSLYGRQEHRVFGLEPNTDFEFQIIACNLNGECQLSNKVILQTELSLF